MANFGCYFVRNFVRHSSACTVYSLSSGFVKCGVAVIRVSGPRTKFALQTLVGSNYEPNERYAYLKALYHPESKEMIDKGLVLWFSGPASYTGEDSCEFQVHGSIAVIVAVLDALGMVPGLRPAEPGEFTKRAFFGGKLDLTEVEGLADLIHAETEAQRKQALLQSTGALARLYNNWRKRLIKCAAHLEAYIDFAEDEHIDDEVTLQLTKEMKRVRSEICAHLGDQRQGELLREGVRTAILGAPNVGKSSFLNVMCQRKVSIVNDQAGTTRDIIETMHNFGGYPVVFADTAGLRKSSTDTIEKEGIERAKECFKHADLILLLTDAKELLANQIFNDASIETYTKTYLESLDIPENEVNGKRLLLVANKSDLLTEEEISLLSYITKALIISCRTQYNFPVFFKSLEAELQTLCGQPIIESPRITHVRYRQQLQRCIEHIDIFLNYYTPDIYPDLAIAAQKLRNSVRCIERITGHVSTDDILDVVFKDFCIGK